jgi:hypothetical protein
MKLVTIYRGIRGQTGTETVGSRIEREKEKRREGRRRRRRKEKY